MAFINKYLQYKRWPSSGGTVPKGEQKHQYLNAVPQKINEFTRGWEQLDALYSITDSRAKILRDPRTAMLSGLGAWSDRKTSFQETPSLITVNNSGALLQRSWSRRRDRESRKMRGTKDKEWEEESFHTSSGEAGRAARQWYYSDITNTVSMNVKNKGLGSKYALPSASCGIKGVIQYMKGRNLESAQTDFRFHLHLSLSCHTCFSSCILTPCAGLVISHYARSHLGNWAMQSGVMYARGGEAQWPASLSISPNPLATVNTYLPHLYLDFTNVDISEHNCCYPAISRGPRISSCSYEDWQCAIGDAVDQLVLPTISTNIYISDTVKL